MGKKNKHKKGSLPLAASQSIRGSQNTQVAGNLTQYSIQVIVTDKTQLGKVLETVMNQCHEGNVFCWDNAAGLQAVQPGRAASGTQEVESNEFLTHPLVRKFTDLLKRVFRLGTANGKF